MIEERLRQLRRVDETYVKIRGKWRYLVTIEQSVFQIMDLLGALALKVNDAITL